MKNKKLIGILIILSFLISFLTPVVDFSKLGTRNVNATPKTSTNYIFNNRTYDFNLDDFYDDANLYKIYTGAKFQTEVFDGEDWSGVVNNDTVTPVDNDEIQYGDPSNIDMVKGTTDSADNMKVLDASYTQFNSARTDEYFYESPAQWGDFVFTKGSGGATGELETNDGDYARIDAEFTAGGESLLGIINPADSDILTGWVDGDAPPHWNKLDEGVGGAPDGGNIRTLLNGIHDRWNFDTLTIPGGGSVTKLVMWGYCQRHIISDSYIRVTTSVGASGDWTPPTDGTYKWKSITVSGLSINQAELDAFWMNVQRLYGFIPSFVDIEAVYVEVYVTTSPTYSCDYEITWDVTDPDLGYIDTFYYDYRTTVAIDCDLDIYNWDTTDWLELESNTGTSYITGSYSLTDPYIDGSDYVKIRLQTEGYVDDFDMELDQIVLGYWNIYRDVEMTITFPFTKYNEDLLAMNVSSWHRTNISQTITFKIWNYNTESWVQISSSSDTSFTKKEYNTESPANFISPSGTVKLNWTGSDTLNDFELHIDYLVVQIFYKLDLEHSKSFDTNGIYRYRWCVLGSIHYTQWVVFEIIDPVPNFHAISESDVTTRWILQDNELTAVEDFHDDISGSNWNLIDVSINIIQTYYIPTDDTNAIEDNPDTTQGSVGTVRTSSQSGIHTWNGFVKWEYPYLDLNYTNSSMSLYGKENIAGYLKVYHTTDFDEDTLTWNNQPASGEYQVNFTGFLGRQEVGIGAPNYYYKFVSYSDLSMRKFLFWSSEWYENKPYFIHNLYKSYLGSGMMYMQTNTTELLSLKSTDYGSYYTLSSGDYFEMDFQTSSDSQINLILLRDGVVNKTLTLSKYGNPNFNRHTAKISVDEEVEFDQLKISSTFEDTDNIKVYDIKTKKYTITGDSADFYVGSRRTEDVYLTPDAYNLRIFEEGDEKIDANITIGSTDYYYVYIPIANLQCRLTLFSTEGDFLNFEDYHITVNRSLNGEYYQFSLLDNLFYADVETYAYIDVYDRFDALINSFERLASDYIDLEIEVYSLQIKNLQTQKTTVDINTTHVYPLLSGDSIYFMLSKNYYQIGYYDTNDVYKQFLIYLDSNQAYELNRSKICFLAYVNQRGEHLYFDDYKTYINDSLIYENVFYREIGDIIGIEVKDLYGISIKNQTYTVVSGDNYIPVVLTMYSLKVMNQQEQFNHINITRDPNYYESGYYWSEWIAPNEIIKFRLFPGYYKINLTDNEGGSYSFYEYTLNGDDILLISSDNVLSQVIYNIANVNTTIGNQITNVEINITNQNSQINNTIVNIEINLSNVNSTLGNLLTNIDLDIINLQSDINSLYTFTNTSIWNLNNAMNSSFIYMENNIYSINQSISTLVIGIDNSISLVNATITSMFTEMSNQFIVVQSTLNYSFAFLNQTIIQLANNITENHVILYNLIEQRANDIDSSLIDVQTLINLVNNTVADESLVIQTLVNLIGANITNNHIIINNFLNLIDNNITNNNIQLVSILEVIGNNITTNHFVIQTLLDVIGNNITYNHIEMLTNLNLINTTISQNQIELINRLLFINNTVNDLMFELTNQLLFLNGTIYSAVLNLSTSVEFGVDMVLGNITITYQQNEFLTELYKETMFSQLLNWSGVAYNYTLMEDRIDVWEFINNYRNDSVQVLLRYNDLIDNLTISAQNTIEQYLPNEDVEYRLKSVATGEYLSEWEELPENKTVSFGFYETEVPSDPLPLINAQNMLIWFGIFVIFILFIIIVLYVRFKKEKASIPIELRRFIKQKKKKSNIKKNGYSDKDIYID